MLRAPIMCYATRRKRFPVSQVVLREDRRQLRERPPPDHHL
jgi:hypothetical protein